MDTLATISGAMLVLSVSTLHILGLHAHVIPPLVLHLQPLLSATTTANQAIQPKIGKVKCFPTTRYGMESSAIVTAHAALVPTLHYGSV